MPITVGHGSPGSALGAKYAIGVSKGNQRLANAYMQQQKLNQGQDVLQDRQMARTRREQRSHLDGIYSNLPKIQNEGTLDPMTLNRLNKQKQAIYELTHSPDYPYADKGFQDTLSETVSSYNAGVTAAGRDPRIRAWEDERDRVMEQRRSFIQNEKVVLGIRGPHSMDSRLQRQSEERFPLSQRPLTAVEMERQEKEIEFQQLQGEKQDKEAETKQKRIDDAAKIIYANQPQKDYAAALKAAATAVDGKSAEQEQSTDPRVIRLMELKEKSGGDFGKLTEGERNEAFTLRNIIRGQQGGR